jgi:hypothetical protein
VTLPPLLLGTGLLLLLLALSAAMGRRLLTLFHVPIPAGFVRALLGTGLGLGALQLLPFALLACCVGTPAGIRIAISVLALLLAPDLIGICRAGARLMDRARELWRTAPLWQRFLSVLFAALLFAVYLRALCPIIDDDGLSYHLAGATRWLQAGRFQFLPTLTYTNWPSCTEMLFVLLRGLHPTAPVGLVQFTYGSLTLVGVMAMGRRIGGPNAGWPAAVLLLAYKVFWEEMPQAHVDLGSALFATLAVLSLQCSARSLSAVFAGLGATCKLNGLWIVAAIALVVVLTPGKDAGSLRNRVIRAAAYFATGISVVVPWFARSWVVAGNPLYPMFFGIFGGREWTSEGWPRVQRYFFLMNTPPGFPPTHTVLLLGRAGLVSAAALLAVLVYRRTRHSPAALPARYGFTFIPLLFLSSGYNLRFLLPAYPCVMAAASCALAPLLFRMPKLGPVLLCLFAAVLTFRIGVNGLDPRLPESALVALGVESAEAYLRDHLPDYPAVEYCNANLPPESRILVGTWEEATAYYRAFAVRPNYWLQDSVHYDSPERLDADLARLGVTHLVFKPMDPDWCPRSSVCDGRMTTETRALEALIRRRGEKLFEANGYTVYRLSSSGG